MLSCCFNFEFDDILIDEKSNQNILFYDISHDIINQKIGITYIFSHNYTRIKIDSYNVMIFIKLVFN